MLLQILENIETFNGLALGLSTLALYVFIIKPLYFAPLSKVPGPKITALTKYWILYKTWSEQRNRLVHKLHEKYGPVVRLSPNEISIADPKYIKTIYSGNFDKSSFYAQFDAYGHRNAFSSCQKAEHLSKRKIINQVYSKTSICSPPTEEMTQKRIENAMKFIDNSISITKSHYSSRPTIEVYNLFHAMAMDTATGFILGDSNGTNLLDGADSQDWQMLEMFRQRTAMWFWVTLMPRFYWLVQTQSSIVVADKIADWMKRLVLPVQQTLSEKTPSHGSSVIQSPRATVIEQLYMHGVKGLAALSEIEDHTVAGHETTGATLSYLCYHLSLNSDIQEKLRNELLQLDQTTHYSNGQKLDYRSVDSLPYLNGVLMETLRLYGAIPGAEPRLVPRQGMICRDYMIPAKTIVSIQPWTLHRDPNVFKDPLVFRPERWYHSSQPELKEMNKSFMAFGAGIRMCIGMHLAVQEMKLITANIYRKYKTTVSPQWSDHENDMRIVDKYTVHPQGHRCLLEFNELRA